MDSRLLRRLALSLAMSVGVAGEIPAQSTAGGHSAFNAVLVSTSDTPFLPIREPGAANLGHTILNPSVNEPVPSDRQSVSRTKIESSHDRPVTICDLFPLFSGDSSLDGAVPISEELRSYGLMLSINYDAFRGVPDGGWGNYGIRNGIDFATSLGSLSELTGIGLQAGASVGVYDWAGTDYRLQNQNKAETQGFFTYGLFRKPTEDSRITVAIVQDWSINDTFGVLAHNPSMSQLRGQFGYALSASNEFGIWGTTHVVSDRDNVNGFGAVTWQSINQLSAYWHHKWYAGGPDTWISVGAPEKTRLAGGGSVGDYLVSATASAPFSDAVSLFGSVTYMHQSAGEGGVASHDEAWNVTVGICIYPQRNARTTTVAGERWMPLLPVATNGSFLVDTDKKY